MGVAKMKGYVKIVITALVIMILVLVVQSNVQTAAQSDVKAVANGKPTVIMYKEEFVCRLV